MAQISGLEIIAITDHNTCKNAPAVLKAAQEAGIVAIPGMELCTSEEAHVVCLFESLEGAMEFDRYIYDNMPHIKNKPEIFGEQRVLSENDPHPGAGGLPPLDRHCRAPVFPSRHCLPGTGLRRG